MNKKYDHKQIETKWQAFWDKNQTFRVEMDPSKPKYYVLDMFPFPSGAGLHVGHVVGYTATDIISRFKRKKGFSVLHPMGWDSFGLPAEQYAVRTGTHPALTTKKNVDNYRRQLKSLGFSYDWNREFATSDPSYYKWTQWIFTKLYERGLAYEAEMFVNYCPALGTVLANEEVDSGKSKEGGFPVERRPLKQWVLKITAYAERLIKDLDLVDWPDSIKRLQTNWIGKSEGALIHFALEKGSEKIQVFTTCPDTLFGVTYVVLAPEHPLVKSITTPEYEKQVREYQEVAKSESDLDRTELNKDKSGVFTGAYALNPATGNKIPIWIADYVLMGYGTGCVMGVPAHDERDFEFAKKYGLKIVAVKKPRVDLHPELVPTGKTALDVEKMVSEGNLCWIEEGDTTHSSTDEISFNGLNVADTKEKIKDWLEKKGQGKRMVTYKLRDWLFSRQRYWGEPFPVLHFEDGTQRVLGIDELPLTLPEVSDYKPSGDGKSPLAKVQKWVEIVDPKTGKKALRETNTMPNWAGSCWYYLRFEDPHNEKAAWDPEKEKYWSPVDLYVGGVEHAVLHLLYSRFWHKVLYDCGLVAYPEPFKTLRNQGIVTSRSYQKNDLAYVPEDQVIEKEGKYFHKDSGEELKSQIDKMSKSKLNGVAPDEIIEEYGADSLRLYEMFMGPMEKEKIWNTDAVSGCRRFLNRVYDLVVSDKLTDEDSDEANKLGHRLVHGVNQDVEALQFNTGIAKMMEFINDFSKLPKYPKKVVKMLAQVLSAFAPHIADEMWELLGEKGSLAYVSMPEVDPKYLVDETVTYVVQVNGKLRGRFEMPKDQPEDVILNAAKDNPSIQKYLENVQIQKVIFVPNKLLNIVVS
jgi:leucyl-tRNA synthetase